MESTLERQKKCIQQTLRVSMHIHGNPAQRPGRGQPEAAAREVLNLHIAAALCSLGAFYTSVNNISSFCVVRANVLVLGLGCSHKCYFKWYFKFKFYFLTCVAYTRRDRQIPDSLILHYNPGENNVICVSSFGNISQKYN